MKQIITLLFLLISCVGFAQKKDSVVIVNQNVPVANTSIRINCGCNAKPPVYVVDNVITTDLINIAPNDIFNIIVLKDFQATTIYGANAKNGVLLITTKKYAQKVIDKKLDNFSKEYQRFVEIGADLKVSYLINDKDSDEQAVYNLPVEQILSVKFNNNNKPIVKINTKF